MSQLIRSLCIVALSITCVHSAKAQQPSLGCDDKGMRLQAEQLKQDFTQQGMTVYKDAMISMESKQPFPVAVQFEKGHLYQLIFIGNKEAKKITMELYDGADKKIDERNIKQSEKEPNRLVYSFVPEKTDMYLVVLTQNKGLKNICGSFTIMDNVAKKTEAATQPATAKPAPAPNPRYVPKKK